MTVTEYELEERAKAPRVSLEDVHNSVKSVYYFTAANGVSATTPSDIEDIRTLRLLTFCVLVLKNGFTVTGQSACASPENYDKDIGEQLARDDALRQIWPLLGYELRTTLHRNANLFKKGA